MPLGLSSVQTANYVESDTHTHTYEYKKTREIQIRSVSCINVSILVVIEDKTSSSTSSWVPANLLIGLKRLMGKETKQELMCPLPISCSQSTSQVLLSLRILLLMKPSVLSRVSHQVAYGLHELLKTNAANIHSSDDWATLFTLLECIGSGVKPPAALQATARTDVPDAGKPFPRETLPDG